MENSLVVDIDYIQFYSDLAEKKGTGYAYRKLLLRLNALGLKRKEIVNQIIEKLNTKLSLSPELEILLSELSEQGKIGLR